MASTDTRTETRPGRFISVGSRLRWPLVALGLGLALSLYPLAVSGMGEVPGGPGDSRLVAFSLEHGYGFLAGRELHQPFWDPPLFHPEGNVAAYTDLLLGAGLTYWPLRALGLAPDTAFQVWLVLAFVLNFTAFTVLLRRMLRTSVPASSVGGYLFAFGSSRMANIGHPQLLFELFVVVALIALGEVFRLRGDAERQGVRRGWWTVFFAALTLQAWTAFYPLFFLALFLSLAGLVALVVGRSRRALFQVLRADWAFLVPAAGCAALLVLPVAERYLLTRDVVGARPYSGIENVYAPRPWSWLLTGPTNRLYGTFSEVEIPWDPDASLASGTHALGVGFLTPLLALAGLLGHRRRMLVSLVLVVGGIVVLLATCVPGVGSLWRFVYGMVPGATGIRALGRIGLHFLVPAGMGIALVADRLAPRRRGTWLVLALLGVVAAENAHDVITYDKAVFRNRVSRIAKEVGPECESFFVTGVPGTEYQPVAEDAMWAALELEIPTVNGRYGNSPPDHSLGMPVGRPSKFRTSLRHWVETRGLGKVCWVHVAGDRVAEVPFEAGGQCR